MGEYVVESRRGYYLYHFNPSVPGAATVLAIFFVIACMHAFRIAKTRCWFCVPLIVGSLFETIGYAARIPSHNNTASLIPFIVQGCVLLVAPAIFAASVYMVLARIIVACDATHYSIIRPKLLTKLFVVGDVFCFVIQGSGAGYLAKGAGDHVGENIILAGLILQIVIFGLFVTTAGIFHRRLNRGPTARSQDSDIPWRKLLQLLYGVSAIITIRNAFRVVEYSQGVNGWLLQREWPLYVFDAMLMILVAVGCLVFYIKSIIPPKKTSLEKGQSNEDVSLEMQQQSVPKHV